MIFERSFVNGTERDAVLVVLDFASDRFIVGITGVNGNTGSIEAKPIHKQAIVFVRVERGICEKGVVRKSRMRMKELRQNGVKRGRISNFFVQVRIVSLFRDDFRVSAFETLVKKVYATKNAYTVG